MTLQQMEYIVAVNRWRHFAKAAEHCHVTQPTLSAMVQRLEDELGVKIFDRTTSPVTPTPVGRLVVEQAWKTLARARRLRAVVEEERHSLEGTFRIGILPTIAPYLLPRFFPQLMADHPALDLRIVEMQTADIKRALVRGDLDAAILVSLDGMDAYVQTPLFYEQFLVYVSRGDRLFTHESVKTTDLTGEELWLLDEGHCFRDQLVKFCALKSARASQQHYALGSMETFMRMVEGGKGVTFVPELAVAQFSEAQRQLVRPFALPVPVREVVLLTTAHYVRQTFVRLLADRIRASVPEAMLSLDRTKQRL